MKTSDKIQIGVLIVIFITAVLMLWNIIQQGKFNRNSLRPWVYTFIKDEIERIKGGYININYRVGNTGRTPVYKAKTYTILNLNKDFPEKEFKTVKPDSGIGFIFPNIEITHEVKLAPEISFEKIFESKNVYIHLYLQYLDFDNKHYYLRVTYKVEYEREFPKSTKGYSIEKEIIYASDKKIR